MRKALGLLLVLPFLAQAKVEDRPLITPNIQAERWVKAWNKSEDGLSGELLERRQTLLRLLFAHLTTASGAHGIILLNELPDSELSDAVSDLIKFNSGLMHEMSLEQLFQKMALHGDLIYDRGLNLSESGVTLEAMKGALGAYLKHYKEHELATTVLKFSVEELRLAFHASPEFELIFKYFISMLKQQDILNFRIVATTSPEAFSYIWGTQELIFPFYDLEFFDSLQVIDGAKLDFGLSCEEIIDRGH